MEADRRLPRVLWGLLLLDLLWQVWGLARGWDSNPNLRAPLGDADTYWKWAEAIAHGQLIGDTPFLSAPLYPYFLGLIRALGGGMLTVFVVQILLRSATAWLLARSATRLFRHPGFGLATAASFLLLSEPAFYATRLLNVSLQLFTLALLIERCLAWGPRRHPGRLGALLGLTLLSNPALLLVLPVFLYWCGWRRPDWAISARFLGACLLCLLPATWHNYLATKDSPGGAEFILLSAQAGITFSHGNAEGAEGIYHPLAGVSANRERQNEDAYAYVKAETGEEGWSHTSSYFLHRGLSYLLANPGAAIVLEWRKLRWFFAGRHYGDVYNLTLENQDDAFPRPVPLPSGSLPLPWLLPAAFAGLWLIWRRDRRAAAPLLALGLAPLAVVLIFWFSPRYRLPVVPVAVLLAPYALWTLAGHWRHRLRPRLAIAAVLALLPGLAIEGWSQASGFDRPDGLAARYQLHNGLNELELGHPEAALARLREAARLGHEDAVLHQSMAEALVQIGAKLDRAGRSEEAAAPYAEAIEEYRRALAINATRLDAHFSLASVLEYVGRREEARAAQQAGLAEAERQGEAAMIARFRALGQRLR